MNFGLLAEAEQDAVIYTYASMLNSLNYPIQIIIQSQTKDATNYLNLLKQQEEKASADSKRERIAQYRHFVTNLIKERNVLDKKFYCVVPATAIDLGLMTAGSVIPGKTEFDITKYEKSLILEKAVSVLEPRRDHLVSQFARIGLFARQLTTQEIIRIFYTNYNPDASEGQEIADTSQYSTPLVRANLIKQTQEVLAQAQAQPIAGLQSTNQKTATAPPQPIPSQPVPLEQPNTESTPANQGPSSPPTPIVPDINLSNQTSTTKPQLESIATSQPTTGPLPAESTNANQTPVQNFTQPKPQVSSLNFQESVDDFGLSLTPTNPTPTTAPPSSISKSSIPQKNTTTAPAASDQPPIVEAKPIITTAKIEPVKPTEALTTTPKATTLTVPPSSSSNSINGQIPTPSFTNTNLPPTSVKNSPVKNDKEKTQNNSPPTTTKNLKPTVPPAIESSLKPAPAPVNAQTDSLQSTINQTLKEVGSADVYNKKMTQPTPVTPSMPATPPTPTINDQNLPPIAEIT